MNFLELLSSLNVRTVESGNHHCRPGWVQIDCPFCNEFGEFHLGVNKRTGHLNCWKCGHHGQIETLAHVGRMSFIQARKLVEGLDSPERVMEEREVPRGTLKLPDGLDALGGAHRRYLEKRGFAPDELIETWQIQGLGLTARLAWRIFIPIQLHGKTVSWTTRSISDQAEVRYISASPEEESRNHHHLLYGEDKAQHAICVVEGPTDVWKIGPGAVATLGVGFSRAQVRRMSRYTTRAVCFDSDIPGQKRARQLIEMLSIFPGETLNIVLDVKDPGASSPGVIRNIRHACRLD